MIARSALWIATCATFAILGCAKPDAYPDPVAAAPIDLRPRCDADLPDFAPIPPAATAHAAEAEASIHEAAHESFVQGVRLFVEPAPRSGLATLSWGFPLRGVAAAPRTKFAPQLGAALLGAGETTSNPEAFRRRLLEIGAVGTTHVEGGWLWLELRFPDTRVEDAFHALSDWLKPRTVRAEIFETIRREVALSRLVADASATNLAARAFRRVRPPPAGALDPEAWGPDDAELTPKDLQPFLESVLRFDDSIVLYAGAEEPERIRQSIEATLERNVSQLAAQTTSRTWPSRAPSRDRKPAEPEPGADDRSDATETNPPAQILVVDRRGSPQVEILVGHSTLAPLDPEFADLELWASLLGGNVGGRLFRDLRERQGLAYIIDAEQSVEGRFVVTTRARPERSIALLRGIEAHLRALVDVPLENCEVAMLTRRRAGEEALLVEDATAWIARSRTDVAVAGRPRSSRPSRGRNLEALRVDLEAVAVEHLSGVPTIVLVGDADWLRRELPAAFPGREVRLVDPTVETDSR